MVRRCPFEYQIHAAFLLWPARALFSTWPHRQEQLLTSRTTILETQIDTSVQGDDSFFNPELFFVSSPDIYFSFSYV